MSSFFPFLRNFIFTLAEAGFLFVCFCFCFSLSTILTLRQKDFLNEKQDQEVGRSEGLCIPNTPEPSETCRKIGPKL